MPAPQFRNASNVLPEIKAGELGIITCRGYTGQIGFQSPPGFLIANFVAYASFVVDSHYHLTGELTLSLDADLVPGQPPERIAWWNSNPVERHRRLEETLAHTMNELEYWARLLVYADRIASAALSQAGWYGSPRHVHGSRYEPM